MRRHVPAAIRDHLRRLDGHLSRPTRILIIGGAAVALGRDEAHDLDAIADIHAIEPLDIATLILRYHETLSTIIGPPGRLRLALLALIDRLYGPELAAQIETTLAEAP